MSKVYARNLSTGKIAKVPEHYLTHPVIGKNFVAADKHDKDYLPELFKSKVAEVKPRGKREKAEEPNVTITELIDELEASDG